MRLLILFVVLELAVSASSLNADSDVDTTAPHFVITDMIIDFNRQMSITAELQDGVDDLE